jgi:hypothetical protein
MDVKDSDRRSQKTAQRGILECAVFTKYSYNYDQQNKEHEMGGASRMHWGHEYEILVEKYRGKIQIRRLTSIWQNES